MQNIEDALFWFIMPYQIPRLHTSTSYYSAKAKHFYFDENWLYLEISINMNINIISFVFAKFQNPNQFDRW